MDDEITTDQEFSADEAAASKRPRDPESAAEFRAFLAEIGETQWSFGRTLKRLGDPREKGTIQRNVQRMATGEARISGEMRVIMNIFRHGRRKRRAKAEAAVGQVVVQDRNIPSQRSTSSGASSAM